MDYTVTKSLICVFSARLSADKKQGAENACLFFAKYDKKRLTFNAV